LLDRVAGTSCSRACWPRSATGSAAWWCYGRGGHRQDRAAGLGGRAGGRRASGPGGALVDRMIQGAPPPQLQALINSVAAGRGLHLYILTNYR